MTQEQITCVVQVLDTVKIVRALVGKGKLVTLEIEMQNVGKAVERVLAQHAAELESRQKFLVELQASNPGITVEEVIKAIQDKFPSETVEEQQHTIRIKGTNPSAD